jgi:hypothetical protein
MNALPEPRPTVEAGQRPSEAQLAADKLIAAVNDALPVAPIRVRVDTELPRTAPAPVEQSGRPPMSQQATGASVMLIAGGFFSLCLGAAVSAVMYFSQAANETVVITLCAAPPALFLSLGALMKRLRKVAPDEHHHHYEAPVFQDHSTVTNTNRWWGRSSTGTKGRR